MIEPVPIPVIWVCAVLLEDWDDAIVIADESIVITVGVVAAMLTRIGVFTGRVVPTESIV